MPTTTTTNQPTTPPPPTTTPPLPPPSSSSPPAPPPQQQHQQQQQHDNFSSITPLQLIQNYTHSLILDIRTPSAFKANHLKQAINLNLPTTLLKRPLYGPDKIQSGLPTPEERQRFETYKTALPNSSSHPSSRLQLIVAIDQDARLVNPNHPLILLLKKFSSLGFSGQLVWLNGGFQALLNLDQPSDWSTKLLISQHHPPTPPPTTPHMSLSIPLPLTASLPTPPVPGHNQLSLTLSPNPGSRPINHRPQQSLSHSKTKRVHMSLSMLPPHPTPFLESPSISRNPSQPPNPCYPLPSSNDSNESLSKPNSSSVINPFFDNIRQLNERLSLSSSLQNLSPIDLPELSNPSRDLARLPPFLSRLIQDAPLERARRLAHEFHDLEMAEQHRLEDVMRWESNRSASSLHLPPTSSPSIPSNPSSQTSQIAQQNHGSLGANRHHHPFSISAGVELGYKNRYKNIWPYEHTRIRLRSGQGRRNETDYMNASMISFRTDGAPPTIGSTSQVGRRRYIATQGPLTSTFEDFWSVVGTEDVGLIIMITRRHEAGREKCADYLRNGQYGDLVVSVDHLHSRDNGSSEIESDGDEEREMASGFFSFSSSVNHDEDHPKLGLSGSNPRPKPTDRIKAGVLRKTVRLSRTTRPDLPARHIAHIQYRGWPDFDVPPAAEEVLELIAESQRASQEIQTLNAQAIEEFVSHSQPDNPELVRQAVGLGKGPVIVHCSAGVGRTGSFILLDVMIEVLKALYISNNPSHHLTSPQLPSPMIHSTTPARDHPPPSSDPILLQHHHLHHDHLSPLPHPPQQTSHHQSPLNPPLPRFLDSQLCDCRTMIAPIWQTYPIMAVVNEMREQRMSMVANYRQYVFLHEVLLTYLLKEFDIPVVNDPNNVTSSSVPTTPTMTPTNTRTTSTSTNASTSTNTSSSTNMSTKIEGFLGSESSLGEAHPVDDARSYSSRSQLSPYADKKQDNLRASKVDADRRSISPSVISSSPSNLLIHNSSASSSDDNDNDVNGMFPIHCPPKTSSTSPSSTTKSKTTMSSGDYFF